MMQTTIDRFTTMYGELEIIKDVVVPDSLIRFHLKQKRATDAQRKVLYVDFVGIENPELPLKFKPIKVRVNKDNKN